jgi:K+-transporting ATPase KdpF subunit
LLRCLCSIPETNPQGVLAMIFDYTLAGLVTVGLFFYLTFALMRPERF